MDERLAHILATDGAVHAGVHRGLRQRIQRAVSRGDLVRLLPGVYGTDGSFRSRILAMRVWDENAILIGSTAARMTWWPDLRDDVVRVSSRRQSSHRPGFELHRLQLPSDLVLDIPGHRCVLPSLSVLQLIPLMGPVCIDEALRRRATSIAALQHALRSVPNRAGNQKCLRYLRLSRDEPWSHLEREAHQLLREAGLTGWRANHPVRIPSGLVYLDIAFLRLRIAVEVDGFKYHSSHAIFHSDRRRDVELQMAGWRVLRFTADTLSTMPAVLKSFLRKVDRGLA